jgi:hypothetical protein
MIFFYPLQHPSSIKIGLPDINLKADHQRSIPLANSLHASLGQVKLDSEQVKIMKEGEKKIRQRQSNHSILFQKR